MQQFQPFYGPKDRLAALSRTEVIAKEELLTEEIEAAILQIRSIAHITQTNMNFTRKMMAYIKSYMNYMEDSLAGRLDKE